MRMLPNVLPVATCGLCPHKGLRHGQTACEPASQGEEDEEGGGAWLGSFMQLEIPVPPIPSLVKQEGLQLVDSFRAKIY